MPQIKVGLIGFGIVGAGVAEILINNSEIIKTRLGSEAVLKNCGPGY